MREPPLILVAEDNDAMRESVVILLNGMGYRADGVPDGEMALLAIEEKAYDAVVSDVRMPKVDGVELLEKLHDRAPYLCDRFVFITSEPNLVPERLSCPVLKKPFRVADLSRALKKAIRKGSGKLEQV